MKAFLDHDSLLGYVKPDSSRIILSLLGGDQIILEETVAAVLFL